MEKTSYETPAFEIRYGDGSFLKIYASGKVETEGKADLDERTVIVNRIPTLLAAEGWRAPDARP